MKLSLFFLKKYFRSPRQEWRRPGSLFMVLGIIISVATLTIAFTIFDGYERMLKKTILSTNSHVYIFSTGRDDLTSADCQRLNEFFAAKPEVKASDGLIISQAMATAGNTNTNSKVISCQLRGLNWQKQELPITYREYVQKGSWRLDAENDVVVGNQLAQRLGLDTGDTIYLVSPAQNSLSLLGLRSQSHPYKIEGLYHSGIYESDSRVVFMQPGQAWKFSNQPGRYSRYEVKLKPEQIDRADYLAYIWQNELNLDYQISTWQDFNSSLFNLLKLEKWVLFFILSFLIVVASFNVVSSVSTEIIDRRREIGILKTIGFSNRSLRQILLGRILGTGVIAIFTGELLGMLLAWFASIQDFFKLKGDVYFLDKINVYFSIPAMLLILAVAFIIIYLAAALPLRRLNRLEITEILRS
ncbi:MAG: ABC transporter permease [Candidatus Cloacimonetes bacterium]|nr:ABC transporter permease [Candidatus Cloacimonadota bacterium]